MASPTAIQEIRMLTNAQLFKTKMSDPNFELATLTLDEQFVFAVQFVKHGPGHDFTPIRDSFNVESLIKFTYMLSYVRQEVHARVGVEPAGFTEHSLRLDTGEKGKLEGYFHASDRVLRSKAEDLIDNFSNFKDKDSAQKIELLQAFFYLKQSPSADNLEGLTLQELVGLKENANAAINNIFPELSAQPSRFHKQYHDIVEGQKKELSTPQSQFIILIDQVIDERKKIEVKNLSNNIQNNIDILKRTSDAISEKISSTNKWNKFQSNAQTQNELSQEVANLSTLSNTLKPQIEILTQIKSELADHKKNVTPNDILALQKRYIDTKSNIITSLETSKPKLNAFENIVVSALKSLSKVVNSSSLQLLVGKVNKDIKAHQKIEQAIEEIQPSRPSLGP